RAAGGRSDRRELGAAECGHLLGRRAGGHPGRYAGAGGQHQPAAVEAPGMMLRTWVELQYNGAMITHDIAPDLLGFTYTDNEPGKADDISITLKNDHGKWSGP